MKAEDREAGVKSPGAVALTVNIDGFGDRPNKISKYRVLTRPGRTATMHSSQAATTSSREKDGAAPDQESHGATLPAWPRAPLAPRLVGPGG